jgi:hypothetical protein
MELKVFGYYFRAWLSYLFTSNRRTKFQCAAFNLFQATFRIPQSERASFSLIPKKYLETFSLLLKKRDRGNPLVHEGPGGVFIYDINKTSYGKRKAYIEFFSTDKIDGGIFKEELFFVKRLPAYLLLLFLNGLWLPFLWVHGLFKKDKAPIANLFREQVEAVNLLRIARENNFNSMYHFCIYEKDSNINTLLAQNQGIRVHKIPSEVPLGVWNQVVIADTLCLCIGYQRDEMKYFERSIFVDKTVFFGPEDALTNIDKYKNPVETKKNRVGFYSTGAWVRKLENHSDQGYDMETTEESVKSALRDFCVAQPQYTLMIFLHPRERWEKYTEQTKRRYDEVFAGISYEFSDPSKSSSQSFEETDLAVAFQSTIVYERLYYGFKTLLMPIGKQLFPVPGSNMASICSHSKEELFQKIEKAIHLSNSDFFEQNGIRHFAKYLYN